MSEPSLFERVGGARRGNMNYAIASEAPTPAVKEGPRNYAASSAWAESDGLFWGTPKSHALLPDGVYRMDLRDEIGPVFIRQRNDTDALIELPDSASAEILSEIRQFRTLRPVFAEHGFLYKRGILLWGPPGSGKTCTLQLLIKMLREEHGSVALLVEHPEIASQCFQQLRRIEPDRLIVAILEDVDALCERFNESAYLSLLDGESQIDNIVWVASTNYPERLDPRFVDRPSRFDTVRYIGMPTAAARRVYLKAKYPAIEDTELTDYVHLSDGYSIAHLREFIILTRCFGFSLKDAAKRLDQMRVNRPESTRAPDRPAFGFSP